MKIVNLQRKTAITFTEDKSAGNYKDTSFAFLIKMFIIKKMNDKRNIQSIFV
jgi:hypothetical protein